ncbi:MAG: TnsA endonuclease N-terminal domain-containing protein [Tildeniella nuda ZEHNDER 1965/U140]|jgi:hypothetical protein|nr:TnsA endonuclease N-terminal domain-containing protein [Tildeniella nuda ZEHNDER 1965/U140]
MRPDRDWSEKKYEKYLKEGRGDGCGKQYIPWIQVYKFHPKTGRTRIPGWTTGREHHLLSFLEQKFFLLLDWSDIVFDIQEQFPMLDYELAQKIAKELNWKYPINSRSNFPYILTTDFLVSYKENGREKKIAIAIKPSSALKKWDKSCQPDEKNVLSRLELEYRYWELKKIEWKLVTERQLPEVLTYNLNFIHGDLHLEATTQNSIEELQIAVPTVKEHFAKFQGCEKSIYSITDYLDRTLKLQEGTAFRIFKHLIACKKIIVNLETFQLDENPSMTLVKQVVFS